MTEIKRRFDVKTCWPWMLLTASVLFFAFRYMPAACLGIMSGDVMNLVIFYRDIVEQGHSAHGWAWGGASFEFPDMAVVWALNFLLGDGLTAMAAGAGVFFVCWVAGVVMVYKAAEGRRPGVFASLVVLLAVALAHTSGILAGDGILTFMPVFHAGAMLVSLACLAITLKIRRQGYSLIFWVMSLLLVPGASSDPIFLVVFTAPVLTALAAATLYSRQTWRTDLLLACNIALSSVAGVLLRPVLFHAHLSTGYTNLDLAGTLKSLQVIRQAIKMGHAGFSVLIGLDVLSVLLCLAMVIPFAPWNRKRPLGAVHLFVLSYAGSCVAMNWGAAILTGNYTEVYAIRYVTFALALPPLILVWLIAESIHWGRKSAIILALGVAVFTVIAAIPLPCISTTITNARLEIPVLREVMSREHIEAGLGNYWFSHELTFLSGGTVKLAAITPDGNPYRWFNSIQDYAGYDKTQALPAFRLIFMNGLDPAAIKARFGEPAEIIPMPVHQDIWIYSPRDAIHFSEAFICMGNIRNFPDVNTFHIAACSLASRTGKREGESIAARAGRDKQGFMIYGPYLHFTSGRYKVEFTYTYEAPPAPDREAVFDCNLTVPKGDARIDQAPIPFVDRSTRTFTRTVTIPKLKFSPDQCVMETRVFYHESGDLRIDSLTVTRLDTP